MALLTVKDRSSIRANVHVSQSPESDGDGHGDDGQATRSDLGEDPRSLLVDTERVESA